MTLAHLRINDFRNFSKLALDNLNPGVNVVIERNGFGKSNLLESIYLLATGSSPRTSHVREVIRWNESLARVEGEIGENTLSVVVEPKQKTFLINRKKVDFRHYLFHFAVVFFQPTDLHLLTGTPKIRRNFLDRLIGQYDFEYLYELATYNKLLAQRNMLLRDMSGKNDVVEVIEDRLAQKGAVIFSRRSAVIERLNGLLSSHELRISYLPSPKSLREFCGDSAGIDAGNRDETVREILREKMRELREKERLLKFSLIGNQRDDFSVELQDELSPGGWKDVGVYGSRGQQRITMVRLKMGERDILHQVTESMPILLLDDIFSELDETNRHILVDEIGQQQTFLTAALNDQIIPEYFPQDSRINLQELILK